MSPKTDDRIAKTARATRQDIFARNEICACIAAVCVLKILHGQEKTCQEEGQTGRQKEEVTSRYPSFFPRRLSPQLAFFLKPCRHHW
jgi:hypothetical protein